eukprot:3154995-Rhodomonas_salina.4
MPLDAIAIAIAVAMAMNTCSCDCNARHAMPFNAVRAHTSPRALQPWRPRSRAAPPPSPRSPPPRSSSRASTSLPPPSSSSSLSPSAPPPLLPPPPSSPRSPALPSWRRCGSQWELLLSPFRSLRKVDPAKPKPETLHTKPYLRHPEPRAEPLLAGHARSL